MMPRRSGACPSVGSSQVDRPQQVLLGEVWGCIGDSENSTQHIFRLPAQAQAQPGASRHADSTDTGQAGKVL